MALQKQQACCLESMEKHATHVLEQDWLKRGCGISQHVIHYQIFLKQWICSTIGVGNTNWELLTWPSGPYMVEKNAMRQTIRTVFYQLMTEKIPVPDDLAGFLLGKENTVFRLEFGVQKNGKFIEQSAESVEINPFKQQELQFVVPKYNGQTRNAVRHYYLRSKIRTTYLATRQIVE